MNKKIGFIGCGNMGKAILNGLISGKIISLILFLCITTARPVLTVWLRNSVFVVNRTLSV